MALDRSQRSRSERRDGARRLLLAALEEMLNEGVSFSAVKVDKLAARAGMSRATFYIHFQDKVELLEQWLDEANEVLFATACGWYRAGPDLTRDNLCAVVHATIREYRERATLMAAMHEAALHDSALRDDFDRVFQEHFEALSTHIVEGQAAGYIAEGLQPRETAEWLLCMIEHAPSWLPARTGKVELRRQAEAATRIIWMTLYDAAPRNRT